MYFEKGQAAELIRFAIESYGETPEIFNAESPDVLIFRHASSRKWYGAMMNIPMLRLGIDSAERVDVINVKLDPVLISLLVDGEKYFRAYHMNKEHWLTAVLDGRTETAELISLLDQSYYLTMPKAIRTK